MGMRLGKNLKTKMNAKYLSTSSTFATSSPDLGFEAVKVDESEVLVGSDNLDDWSGRSDPNNPLDDILPPKFIYKDLPSETLYILDATSMIYNAYFSREGVSDFGDSFMSVSGSGFEGGSCDGNHDSKVSSSALTTMSMHFARFIRDVKPRYVVAALDVSRTTFRSDLYTPYKQQRPSTPHDLAHQFPLVKPVLEALGVPTYGVEGYEADDVMATISLWARAKGLNVCLVSGDKDMLQLVDVGVHVMNPRTREMTGVQEVRNKYGVSPSDLVDLMALAGDSADNIPGVKGIGLKTAAAILTKFKSIEQLYAAVHNELNKPGFDSNALMSGKLRSLSPDSEGRSTFTIEGTTAKDVTLLKKFATTPFQDVEVYKKLIQLCNDVPTIIDTLSKASSTHLRYTGETEGAYDMLCKIDNTFSRPLTLLRRQYSKLDRTGWQKVPSS